MPSNKETITTKVLVKPEWDRSALRKMEKDFGGVTKRLASMKTDWAGISKSSGSAVAEIAKISKAAAAMSGSLSDATKKSVKEMASLAKELQQAKKRAEELKRKASSATDPKERASASSAASAAEKQMVGLTRQLRESQKAEKASINEIKQTIKARKLERESLKKAAAYTGKDFRRDVSASLGKSFQGMKTGGLHGVKSALSGLGGGLKAGAKHSSGVSARAALSGEGGVTAGLSKMVPLLAGLAVGFAAVIGFIAKASSAVTSMNKTLIEGTGTANDFISSAGGYSDAIDGLRVASKDATGSLLSMGGSVEGTSKIINSYMREATGSVTAMSDSMKVLGQSTNASHGVEILARNAMAYGKALGMESEDVASMMGKMENEIGVGAGKVQGLMANIVKAAATSNMPVFKFMDIFRATTPALELYTNRMDELAGVIKVLSKNMSAADVKKFTESFSKGFKGESFMDRIKQTLVGGVPEMNSMLQERFKKDAADVADDLNKFGDNLGGRFSDAFKRGDTKAVNEILTQAKGKGAGGTLVGKAQDLMGREGDRRQGDVLHLASASKGGSMMDLAKTFDREVARLTKSKPGERISGIKEQVAEMMNMSQDQIEALNKFNQSIDLYQQSLKDHGTTVSKSFNAAIAKLVARRMHKDVKGVTAGDMSTASKKEIGDAIEDSSKSETKDALSLEDLTMKNYNATHSIEDKIENGVNYLLEEIYESISGVLKVLDNIYDFIVNWGNKGRTDNLAAVSAYNIKGYGKAEQTGFSNYKDALSSGVKNDNMGGAAGDYLKSQYDAIKKEAADSASAASTATSPEDKAAAMASAAASQKSADDMKKSIQAAVTEGVAYKGTLNQADAAKAMDAGDFGKAMKIAGLDANTLLKLGQDLASKSLTNADRSDAKGGIRRRPGTKGPDQLLTAEEKKDAKERNDLATKGLDQMLSASNKDQLADIGSVIDGGPTPSSDSGSPGASATPSSVSSSPQAKISESATKDVVGSQEKAADDMTKSTDDVYDGVHDVLSLLKKGIKLESSFLNGPYAKTIRDSTLTSFKDALMEFGILQAKMQNSPAIRSMIADQGDEVIKAGGMDAIMGADAHSDNPLADLRKKQDDLTKGSKQTGGPIPDTGNYRLHRGEYVVPSMPAGSQSGGGQGGTVNANVIIQGSGLSPKQLEGAVFNAMDKISRRVG